MLVKLKRLPSLNPVLNRRGMSRRYLILPVPVVFLLVAFTLQLSEQHANQFKLSEPKLEGSAKTQQDLKKLGISNPKTFTYLRSKHQLRIRPKGTHEQEHGSPSVGKKTYFSHPQDRKETSNSSMVLSRRKSNIE